MGRQPGVGYWDLILILSAAIISGLAIAPWAAGPEWALSPRLTPKRPRFSRPAATQGARRSGKGKSGHEGGRGVAGLAG